MSLFPIVKRRFTPKTFADYVAGLSLELWRPSMVVLHNTAIPTLAQRPNGFTGDHMDDLRHYYGVVQGWSGGPHLFVDQSSIWVFNPLDKRGTHSPSWNSKAWGVEMLGDYSRESFDTGPGALVRDNAVKALAVLFDKLGIEPSGDAFRLHKEDPKTTHDCPGRNVAKETVRHEVLAAMANLPRSGGTAVKIVAYLKGQGSAGTVVDAVVREGVTYVEAGSLVSAGILKTAVTGEKPLRPLVDDRYDVTPRLDQGKVYLVER